LGVEKQISVPDLVRRYDLVYFKKAVPHVLFEFKSFKIKISNATALQAAYYNLTLKVPYIVLSNGVDSYVYEVDFDSRTVKELSSIPL